MLKSVEKNILIEGKVTAYSVDEESILDIYPSIAVNNIHIIWKKGYIDGKSSQISILNQQGQLIQEKKFSGKEVVIPIYELNAGMYFIRIGYGSKMIWKRFMVI